MLGGPNPLELNGVKKLIGLVTCDADVSFVLSFIEFPRIGKLPRLCGNCSNWLNKLKTLKTDFGVYKKVEDGRTAACPGHFCFFSRPHF